MYFNTSKLHLPGTILFQRMLPNWNCGSTTSPCPFICRKNNSTGANQLLEELCDFLRVGDDDLARSFYGKLIRIFLLVVNAENEDLTAQEHNICNPGYETSLMPVIDNA